MEHCLSPGMAVLVLWKSGVSESLPGDIDEENIGWELARRN